MLEALRRARFQNITTRETIDIMSIAVADGDISAPDAFGLMNRMADSDRYLRLPNFRRGTATMTESLTPHRQ